MKIFKKLIILFLVLFFGYVGYLLYDFSSEGHAHSLDLSIDVQGSDLCLYTNNSNHFLGEPNDETYFYVWIASFDSDINLFEKK